ncbi:uncharacterized protein [Porites lutea]|uniref:uncharacterized protein n=1 Tax=Porites lutea TaxID=51062 RepID=UPI003CC5D4E6
MAAKVDHRRCPSKRKLPSIGEEILKTKKKGKKGKLQEKDESSLRSESTIMERRGKCRGESENTPGSLKETPSSLEFPWLSQKELQQIYEQHRYNQDSLKFEEDSEESDEDNVLTLEELKKTDGYKLTRKGLEAMFGKPQS